MQITELSLKGAYIIEPKVFEDKERGGFFMESFKPNILQDNGISINWIQDNHSKSGPNVLRGLHFQAPPFAQDKLCKVFRGKALVIIVDLRKASPTYGKVEQVELSEDNRKQLLVPKGFAHGFLTLSEVVDYYYKVSAYYSPECEGGLRWDDPDLDIQLPIKDPIVLERDQKWGSFKDFVSPFI